MKLLDPLQIKQKIKRLAIEILEENFEEDNLVLAGINNNGFRFAQLLGGELMGKTETKVIITQIRLNPADPLESEVQITMPVHELNNRVIILVDDVANTGRTIFFAFAPLLKIMPKKVWVAVLVDRKHKSFPVHVDFVGLSLATTLQENIEVQINQDNEMAVFLH